VILVDTPVWVQHLRYDSGELRRLLETGEVLCHPFIVGELACGSIANRVEVLEFLGTLPAAPIADHNEVFHFLNDKRLYGKGLGWIDVHLLASAALAGAELWTRDRALKKAAERLGSSKHSSV
jgi:predicted nucleic acid-binding protein